MNFYHKCLSAPSSLSRTFNKVSINTGLYDISARARLYIEFPEPSNPQKTIPMLFFGPSIKNSDLEAFFQIGIRQEEWIFQALLKLKFGFFFVGNSFNIMERIDPLIPLYHLPLVFHISGFSKEGKNVFLAGLNSPFINFAILVPMDKIRQVFLILHQTAKFRIFSIGFISFLELAKIKEQFLQFWLIIKLVFLTLTIDFSKISDSAFHNRNIKSPDLALTSDKVNLNDYFGFSFIIRIPKIQSLENFEIGLNFHFEDFYIQIFFIANGFTISFYIDRSFNFIDQVKLSMENMQNLQESIIKTREVY